MITDYYDLTALLIAAIDSERDPELTIECAKLLMMKRYIPYRIRLQLFQMDINNLSVTSKQTLFSILSDLNKIRTNFDDIQDVISVIENKKQMTKIYLYAFVNTLLESQSQLQKEVCVINYAVSTHDYRVMAMYNIQHSMLCPEIINSYIDYLLKIGGNYIQATKIVSSISSIRNSLIKINDSTPLLKFSDSKSRLEIDLPNGSELISNQKTLEIVPNWGLRLIILVSILLVIFIYFPVLTLENIEHSKTLKNNEYFRHDHSPPYYISSYTVKNIYSYFKIYNVTFDPKILSLLTLQG
ncbi:hypothetical protein TVAG_137430 [Trichomonas vaginalis G3]|uniref:Uncharacterized protein n=1 Tax=Trichomonas vaginalis (strain ATCC PRA-98 / G3) TaxID=412133 RepID=A2FZC9_TRIV3|nr:hypothetical protein TVAGG3_0795170 [Trichomonas vaginalis G3]EAX89735.1 hypothetical protein TVAG_137430 [Trichomonas vaginalis G3]KAI5496110.1 hypothetical protein TVAGG3_0795170 [Trichomonas vaginalis G3]|eukprot:XP_001302665.1 hypothetical protein [Trichomonas vaginalis G3]